jgi:hypothetical protein
MLIRVQCQHCQNEFEDEGLDRTTFCPACHKETFVLHKRPVLTSNAADDACGVIVLGYVCAVVIPFVGFFVGIYLMAKNQPGHGVTTIALSTLAGLFWGVILDSFMS